MTVEVRRIRADEWERVRALRLEALGDPIAHIAFLDTLDRSEALPDAFWQERAAGGSDGDAVAQFVALDGDVWVGTATVLASNTASAPAGDGVAAGHIVGVYIAPAHRGRGLVEALFDACAAWSRPRGAARLTLDVHTTNSRAQAAYRRVGFAPTGEVFSTPVGLELEMAREL